MGASYNQLQRISTALNYQRLPYLIIFGFGDGLDEAEVFQLGRPAAVSLKLAALLAQNHIGAAVVKRFDHSDLHTITSFFGYKKTALNHLGAVTFS